MADVEASQNALLSQSMDESAEAPEAVAPAPPPAEEQHNSTVRDESVAVSEAEASQNEDALSQASQHGANAADGAVPTVQTGLVRQPRQRGSRPSFLDTVGDIEASQNAMLSKSSIDFSIDEDEQPVRSGLTSFCQGTPQRRAVGRSWQLQRATACCRAWLLLCHLQLVHISCQLLPAGSACVVPYMVASASPR